jgi:drug/metabolite transporter (DMT)-like permease
MGLLAVVAGTAAYAWGAVLSRPVLAGMAPVAVAAWQQGIGGAALLALSAAIEPVDAATPQAFLQAPAGPALAFMTIVSSIVGFTIYLKLLRDWGPFRSGLYAIREPGDRGGRRRRGARRELRPLGGGRRRRAHGRDRAGADGRR